MAVSSTEPTVVPSGPGVVAGSSAGASSSSSSVPLQSAGRRQLRPQQSTDSDCQFVPFDFKTLRHLDFFDDDVPAVAEAVDEPSSLLAICDTEMAQPVDPADDALALQLESGDVHVPSAPGLTCPRCTDDREPPDHNNFDLDKAWQHLPTAPMSLSGMYDTTPNDKAATAPSAREFREANAGRKDKKKGKMGKTKSQSQT